MRRARLGIGFDRRGLHLRGWACDHAWFLGGNVLQKGWQIARILWGSYNLIFRSWCHALSDNHIGLVFY